MDNPYNRVKMMEGTWAVICLASPLPDAELPSGFDRDTDSGRAPALATRSGFPTRADAVRYARTVNPSHEPMVARVEEP